MQIQMTGKEKMVYSIIIAAVIALIVEYKYEPVGITVDVASYAGQRISDNTKQAAQSTTPKVAKVHNAKPVSSIAGNHTVTKDDTCYNIAKRYGSDVAAIKHLNGLDAQCTLRVGQHITVARN